MKIKNLFIVGIITLTTAFGATGCGNTTSDSEQLPLMDVSDDGKTLYANFDNTDIGTGAGSGITLENDEYLVIDSQISEGAVHVKVISGSDIEEMPSTDKPATIDYEFSSIGSTEYQEITPGDYTVFVEVAEKATGSITFSAKHIENTESTNSEDFVHMGGLYISDPENDLMFNMYRTPDGDLVGLVTKQGTHIYGEFTTSDGTLDDGREYTKMSIEGHEFGYHFALENENDDNFVVDEDGTIYIAKVVDESVAMEMINQYSNN